MFHFTSAIFVYKQCILHCMLQILFGIDNWHKMKLLYTKRDNSNFTRNLIFQVGKKLPRYLQNIPLANKLIENHAT